MRASSRSMRAEAAHFRASSRFSRSPICPSAPPRCLRSWRRRGSAPKPSLRSPGGLRSRLAAARRRRSASGCRPIWRGPASARSRAPTSGSIRVARSTSRSACPRRGRRTRRRSPRCARPSSASTRTGSSWWAATPPCSATGTAPSRAASPRWRGRPYSERREVARKARLVAAEMLECAPADVVLAQGVAHVTGLAERRVELGALARASLRSPTLLREGTPGLHACAFFRPETVTWAFGAHACAVEVDVETGALALLHYAAVHDCGRPLNPMVVEGQLHGGIVQGIGAALAEELIYDGDGQLLTGSLMEYGLPRADQVPFLDVIALDFPSARNEMGTNAVEDALIDHGAEVSRGPPPGAGVWGALRRAPPHYGRSRV